MAQGGRDRVKLLPLFAREPSASGRIPGVAAAVPFGGRILTAQTI